MTKMTKVETAGQAQDYYKKDFANSKERYYSEDQTAGGQVSGKLAEEWSMQGQITEEQFARLTEGQHPVTGVQLIRKLDPHEFTAPDGTTKMTNGHVPGWDVTFSAPKSISAQAVYGANPALREGLRAAHRDATQKAMQAFEGYAMARMGGSKNPEKAGKLVAVSFEHDTARPVEGVASPQLHTHVVVFNMTQTEDGKVHSLQTEEMYKAQTFATAVYRSELAHSVRELGFEVERGAYREPEIKGISRAYIEEISYRRNDINERSAETGHHGANAKNLYALETRKGKHEIDPEKTELSIREAAQRHGIDFAKLEREAIERGPKQAEEIEVKQEAKQCLEYSRDHNSERSATFRQDRLVADALDKGMGVVRLQDVTEELKDRRQAGEYQVRREARTSPVLTTRDMQRKEQELIDVMRRGQGKMEPVTRDPPALLKQVEESPEFQAKGIKANEAQGRVFHQVMSSTDQIQAIQGLAGAGKTTSMEAMLHGLEREGYTVKGFGTTGKNTNQLGETGMNVETLASHLVKGEQAHEQEGKVVYFLDESSMASTNQAHEFLTKLQPNERVVLVGDTQQHQSVEAGKPFEQLQDAGMQTAHLDQIVRQKNPVLEEMVYKLERGDVAGAIKVGRENNVFVEEPDPQKRLDYLTDQALKYREEAQERRPGETAKQHAGRQRIILVTPENARKREINETLRVKMQQRGMIGKTDYQIKVLEPRQDLTRAQKTWAEKYEVGDYLKYYKANQQLGIRKDDTARVVGKNAANNTVTVELEGGKRAGRQITYNPAKGGNGVALYRETERTFSPGQEIQFTAKAKFGSLDVKNRDLGTFQGMDDKGNATIRHESGQEVSFNVSEYRNLEQGGCYTSQIAQGQTAGMSGGDFGAKNQDLVTFRAALITVSRAQHECKIVAPDLAVMERSIQREASNETALPESTYRQAPEQTRRQAPAAAKAWNETRGKVVHLARSERSPAHAQQEAAPGRRQIQNGRPTQTLSEELRPELPDRDPTAQARAMLAQELKPEVPRHEQTGYARPTREPRPELTTAHPERSAPRPAQVPTLEQAERMAQEARQSLSGTLGMERTQAAQAKHLSEPQQPAQQQIPGQTQKEAVRPGQQQELKPGLKQEPGQGIAPAPGRSNERQSQQEEQYEYGQSL